MKMDLAVAVPVDNGRGNVFVSYCVSVGYGVPSYNDDYSGLSPTPFQVVSMR